ncbi:MAG: hypothetical protein Q9180_009903, partial [Flavoplaca navasiana]
KSSPPTCLPNCYVIDGQVQLDAPLLLIPPPATVTTSEASIDTSMTTFQTSTTSAVPMDTLLASREHIEERAPPGLVTDKSPPPKCHMRLGKWVKVPLKTPECHGKAASKPNCYRWEREIVCKRDISKNSLDEREDVVPGRFSTTFASPFIPENLCIVHLPRLSPLELANTIFPTDSIPKALTDRTNTPAINTAAFRKLDGNILAAITVEAAKKVGNKAAGHRGKRTESDHAPKGSAVEDSYAEGEDKKDK